MKLSCPLLFFVFLLIQPSIAQTTLNEQLSDIDLLLTEAYDHSQKAHNASDINAVKQHTDGVFTFIWGQSSGLGGTLGGAAAIHGWKTRWQTTGVDYDEDHVARHGDQPPLVDDPSKLGIVGRGRHIRTLLQEAYDLDNTQSHLPHVIHSINNVIGWMRLDDGITKAENQPRVDLTYVWDAPAEFWNSSSDTGWINEVMAQALNILKTDYNGDLEMAHSHAAAMTALLEKCRTGVDADGDGMISPVMMEGGFDTALAHARYAGLLD